MRRTRKRRSVFNNLHLTLPAETHTRLLEVKVPNSLDSELQETMMISKMVVAVVAEEEEVVEVAEVAAIVMTEAHVEAETEVVEAAAAEAAKSSLKMPSQPSEVVVLAKAATKVNVKGLDYSRAF